MEINIRAVLVNIAVQFLVWIVKILPRKVSGRIFGTAAWRTLKEWIPGGLYEGIFEGTFVEICPHLATKV